MVKKTPQGTFDKVSICKHLLYRVDFITLVTADNLCMHYSLHTINNSYTLKEIIKIKQKYYEVIAYVLTLRT